MLAGIPGVKAADIVASASALWCELLDNLQLLGNNRGLGTLALCDHLGSSPARHSRQSFGWPAEPRK